MVLLLPLDFEPGDGRVLFGGGRYWCWCWCHVHLSCSLEFWDQTCDVGTGQWRMIIETASVGSMVCSKVNVVRQRRTRWFVERDTIDIYLAYMLNSILFYLILYMATDTGKSKRPVSIPTTLRRQCDWFMVNSVTVFNHQFHWIQMASYDSVFTRHVNTGITSLPHDYLLTPSYILTRLSSLLLFMIPVIIISGWTWYGTSPIWGSLGGAKSLFLGRI